MNSTLKSKSREHAQKDIADALKESMSEYAVELIEEVASSIEDGVYALCGNNEQTKEYRQKMIFLKMRFKGTRNAKARQAMLGKHISVEDLLAMAPTDFTDSFFANLLSGNNHAAVVSSSSSVGNTNNNPSNTIMGVSSNAEQKKPNVIPSVNPFQRQNQSASIPPVPVQNNRIAGKSRYVNPNATATNAGISSYSSFQVSQPPLELNNNNNNNLNPELVLLPPVVSSFPTDEQQQQLQSQQQQQKALEYAPTGINLINPVGIEVTNEAMIKTLQSSANQHFSQAQQEGNIQSQQVQSVLQSSNQTTPPPPPMQVPRIPPRIGPPQPPSIAKTQPQPFRPVPNQQQSRPHVQSQQQQPSVLSQTPNVSSLNSSAQTHSNVVTSTENQPAAQTKVPNFLSSSPQQSSSSSAASPQIQQHSQQFTQSSSITPAIVQDKQQTTIQQNAAVMLLANPTRSTTTANIPEKNIINNQSCIAINSEIPNTLSAQAPGVVAVGLPSSSLIASESKSIKDKPANPLQSIPQSDLKPTEPTNLSTKGQSHSYPSPSSQQLVSEQLNQTKDDLLDECMRRIKLTQSESHKALTSSIEAAIEPFSRRLLAVEKMIAAVAASASSSDSQKNSGSDNSTAAVVSETIQILQTQQHEQLSKEVALLREEKKALTAQVDELTKQNVALSAESQKVVALNQQITQQNHLYQEENHKLSSLYRKAIVEAQTIQEELLSANEQKQQLRNQLNQMQCMLHQLAQEQSALLPVGQVDNVDANGQQEDLLGQLPYQIQATSATGVTIAVSEGITAQSGREDLVDNVEAEDFFDSLNGCQQADQQQAHHQHQYQQQQTLQAQQTQAEQQQQQQFSQLPGGQSVSIASSQGALSKSNVPAPQLAGGAPLKQRRVAKGNEGMFS